MLEFLTESDVPDSIKDVVDVIGIDAFKDLVKLAGGSLLYISMKYGISEVQVRNIINKE